MHSEPLRSESVPPKSPTPLIREERQVALNPDLSGERKSPNPLNPAPDFIGMYHLSGGLDNCPLSGELQVEDSRNGGDFGNFENVGVIGNVYL